LKNFRQQNRPKKNTLIIGKTAVLNALHSGQHLDKIYLQNNIGGRGVEEVLNAANQQRVPVNKVPVEKLNGFNVGNHDGCVAVISKIQYHDLQQVISFVVDKGDTPLFLILDGITDIRNIGGIARTAFCTGVHALIIPDKGVGALNEDAILTSAGALEKLYVCRVNSLLKAIDDFHLNGIEVIASVMKADKLVYQIDFKKPLAIIMGSEEKGISTPLLKAADEKFKIPMKGEFESLNVSVASGMILYEVMKQRDFIEKSI
jgi:23S rRNA (guanosine2251-2'-O)-methyltransferase